MEQQKAEPITIACWACSVAAALGTFLPWAGSSSAAGFIYDAFFSRVSSPNPEWWVFFFAPLVAAGLMVRGLLLKGKPGRWVLVPSGVFLATWAGVFLTGYRAYSSLGDPGYTLTLLGVTGLAGLSGWSLWREEAGA